MRIRLSIILTLAVAACGGGNNPQPTSGTCQYPQKPPSDAGNDPACPTQYGGYLGSLCVGLNQPCSPSGLTCTYYGAGDGSPGCYAIAGMSCVPPLGADAGAAPVWRCVQ